MSPGIGQNTSCPVSSPDLIWCVCVPPCMIMKVICAGVGFGSGTETSTVGDFAIYLHLPYYSERRGSLIDCV